MRLRGLLDEDWKRLLPPSSSNDDVDAPPLHGLGARRLDDDDDDDLGSIMILDGRLIKDDDQG